MEDAEEKLLPGQVVTDEAEVLMWAMQHLRAGWQLVAINPENDQWDVYEEPR